MSFREVSAANLWIGYPLNAHRTIEFSLVESFATRVSRNPIEGANHLYRNER